MFCRLGCCGVTDVRGRELHCRLPVKSVVRLGKLLLCAALIHTNKSGFGMAVT